MLVKSQVDEDVDVKCHCGNGYCELHGSFHFSDELESQVAQQYEEVARRSGERVMRKQLDDE